MPGRARISGARIWLVSVLLAAGCDGCRAKPRLQTPQPSAAAELPAEGTLIGSVRLDPGAELPSYRAEDMERHVLQHIQGGTFPESCTPPKASDRTPVQLSPAGKLIGVMVAASQFSRRITRPPQIHDVTIKDCRLSPRLVVGQIGDLLNLKNEIQYPFMPTYGANAYNETLIPGQSKAIKMDRAGVEDLMCGFTAPCGRSDVVVVHHPVFAVTDAQGNFRIENFPADETVAVNAWHPLFKDSGATVKLGRGETKTVEFTLSPAPPQPPSTPPPATPPSSK